MDKIATLQNCIVTLGAINTRVDQLYTVAQPIANVIQALGAMVKELQEETNENKDEQGQ